MAIIKGGSNKKIRGLVRKHAKIMEELDFISHCSKMVWFKLYVDLRDGSFKNYDRNERFFERFGHGQSFGEIMRVYVSRFTSENDARRILAATDLNAMKRAFEHVPEVSVIYRENFNGKTSMIRLALIKVDEPDHVAAEFIDVSNSIRMGQEQQKIEDMTQSFLRDYESAYIYDFATETVRVLKQSEVMESIFDGETVINSQFSERISKLIENRVVAEDREKVTNFLMGPDFFEEFEKKHNMSINFRWYTGGRVDHALMTISGIGTPPHFSGMLVGFTTKNDQLVAELCEQQLIDEFSSVVAVNVQDGTFRILKKPEGYGGMWNDTGNYNETLANLNSLVDSESQEIFSKVTTVEDIVKFLGDQDVREFTFRMRSLRSGTYRRCVIRVIERLEGKPFIILVSFSQLDDLAAQALDVERKKLETSGIISSISSDFEYIGYLDFANRSIVSYRCSEAFKKIYKRIGSNLTSAQRFEKFMERLMLDEEYDYFCEHLRFQKIRDRLQIEDEILHDFRGLVEGDVIHYQMKIVPDRSNPDNGFTVGIRNVEKEFRESLRANRFNEVFKILASDFDAIFYCDMTSFELIEIAINNESAIQHYRPANGIHDYRVAAEKYINRFVHEEDREMVRTAVKDAFLRLRYNKSFSLTFRRKCGKSFSYNEVYAIKVEDADVAPSALLVSFKDVDKEVREQQEYQRDLKRAKESAESANQAKSDFLSRMSHDIRTPINGVIGMTDIARKHVNDEARVRDCLSKIDTASHHLLSLINDCLDMSRIESGKTVIMNNPLNLLMLADNCYSIISGQVSDRCIEFVRETDECKYADVLGDELHLRQIFVNILGNAIKFTPPGGKIFFRIRERSSKNGRVTYHFEIEDTGIGMSDDYIAHIWDAFSQEEGGARSDYKGTGLGMTIAKELINLMGGSISVTSELNVGTKFVVELSFEINENVEKQKGESGAADIHGVRILLVEDNELNMEIAKELLTEEGAIVEGAENGQLAVNMFNASEPGYYDIILMDIMMPVMDGLQASKCIRRLDRSDAFTVPIVAMTANAFDEDVKKSREAGMNAHLSKPIQIPVVVKTIANFLER